MNEVPYQLTDVQRFLLRNSHKIFRFSLKITLSVKCKVLHFDVSLGAQMGIRFMVLHTLKFGEDVSERSTLRPGHFIQGKQTLCALYRKVDGLQDALGGCGEEIISCQPRFSKPEPSSR
jgi:hypothetical protein